MSRPITRRGGKAAGMRPMKLRPPRASARRSSLIERLENRYLLATFPVTTLADSGSGSLREAITLANSTPGDDTITFDVTGTINLAGVLPDLSDELSIIGPGADLLTVRRDTGGDYRIFTTSGRVSLSGMTISNGRGDFGGAIRNSGILLLSDTIVSGNSATSRAGGMFNTGTLTLTGVTISDNFADIVGGLENEHIALLSNTIVSANSAGGVGGIRNGNTGTLTLEDSTVSGNSVSGFGGGLHNRGTLTLVRTSVLNNSAGIDGGGLYNLGTTSINHSAFSGNTAAGSGGGVFTTGSLALVNSTISGNSANFGGGGIRNGGELTLVNCTLTRNRADGDGNGGLGGAIHASAGLIRLSNTLVADNYRGIGTGTEDDIAGPVVTTASANNLVGTGGSGGLTSGVNGNLVGVTEPGLAPLADNGGHTLTHALLPGSPAINAGSNTLVPTGVTTDQRGEGFPRIIGDAVDVGSYELELAPAQSLVVTTTLDENDGTSDPAFGTGTSLREAIFWANSNPGADAISFNLPPGPQVINLAMALPALDGELNIIGPGAGMLNIRRDTGGEYRIFRALAGSTVELSGLTISGGAATSGARGGGILNEGTLSLNGVILSANSTASFGGGIHNVGALTVANSTFTANSALWGAGIFNLAGGTLTVTESTFTANTATGYGGGIYNEGELTITGSMFSDNAIGQNGGALVNGGVGTVSLATFSHNAAGIGGALYNFGTLSLTQSTVSQNSATGNSGGIINTGTLAITSSTLWGNAAGNGPGGALHSFGGTLSVTNTTVSGNSTPTSGGGISLANAATLTLTNSTVTNNRANSDGDTTGLGGGIAVIDGTAIVKNSLIAGNFHRTGTMASDVTVFSGSFGGGFNLIGTGGSGGLIDGDNGNLVGVADPRLGPLADNGGPTLTHALLPGSPAINAGSNGLVPPGVTSDQRGTGFPRINVNLVDIGAYELDFVPAESLLVTTSADEDNGTSDAAFGTGTSLREAITWARVNPGPDTVSFDLGSGQHVINLAAALPDLVGEVSIEGPGADVLTVRRDSGGGYRVFTVTPGSVVALSGMTISNGAPAGNGGGVSHVGSSLTLTDLAVTGNIARAGGGIYHAGTGMVLINVTVSDNIAESSGGGIHAQSPMRIINSTISGNSAVAGGGGINSTGGGPSLFTSTITNNRADSTGAGIGSGGGIADSSGRGAASNTIIAGNFIGPGSTRNDVSGTLNARASLIGGDPLLGPLTDNGGPTSTHALLPGSPAINAGDNLVIPPGVSTDQRGPGFPRIVGPRVDIGAFEVQNTPPVADAGGPYLIDEGSGVTLIAAGSSDADGDPLTYTWTLNGTDAITNSATPTLELSWADLNALGILDGNASAIFNVSVSVSDGLEQDSASTTLTVDNFAPSASLSNGGGVDEGSTGLVSFADQVDPSDADVVAGFVYSFDFDNDGTFEIADSPTASATLPASYLADDPSRTVRARIADKDGGFTDYTTTITVNNVAPVVGTITAPTDPLAAGSVVNVSANYTDAGVLDTHTAVWDWGDGTTSAATLVQSPGSGTVSGEHTYTDAGVYTVRLTVTDNDAAAGESVFQYVVIYNPSGGFVTGSGRINVAAGSYAADPSLSGEARFGIVAKYQPGASAPTGQLQFHFQVGDLRFFSTSYQWLVVAGARAQMKGYGTINGQGDYGFLVTVIDGSRPGGGGVDRFRIKIWNRATGSTVFDNQMGASEDDDPVTALVQGDVRIQI